MYGQELSDGVLKFGFNRVDRGCDCSEKCGLSEIGL